MRNVKNITVAVSVDLYRQTRKLAAEYDTTVTAMVAYLLQRLPDALKRAQFPGGRPQMGSRHSAKLARNPDRRRFARPRQPILGERTHTLPQHCL